VELVPYNFVRYSQDFTNGAWVKLGTSLSVTGNTTIAPDGTLTADTLNVSNNNNILYQSASSGFDFTGNTYTFSIYAKGSGTFAMNVRLNSTTTTTETKTLTSEWQRFQVSVTQSAAVTSVECYLELNTSSTYFVWGAQAVEGSTAKDYQKTETRLNIPRLDYSNGTCPSLLVEPQRTNRITYSSSYDSSDWTKVQATISVNNTTSPSGIQDADKIVSVNGTSACYIYQINNVSTGSNYTYSVYLKKADVTWIQLVIANDIVSRVWVDLDNGTIGTNSFLSANIEAVENGWYRFDAVFNGVNTGTVSYIALANGDNIDAFTGNGTSGVYAWGAQLEAGNYSTSYIPTTSASVTRNADVISKTGISSLIGQTEGTLFIDADVTRTAGIQLGNSTSGSDYVNSIQVAFGSSSTNVNVFNGGAPQFSYASSAMTGSHKLAIAYKANDFALYIDGVQVQTDNSGSIPSLSALVFNHVDLSTTGYLYNAVALWKTRLTNTQLAQLTSI
jgi:hypothetical protein